MYYVDRNKIDVLLQVMSDHIQYISALPIDNTIEKLAFERGFHIIIESVLDIGNAMIDGFIMRDPGSYEDIVDILQDEKVINENESNGLKEVISFRKMVVQEYYSIDHKALFQTFGDQKRILELFPTRIKRYLDEELGPVSAFKN